MNAPEISFSPIRPDALELLPSDALGGTAPNITGTVNRGMTRIRGLDRMSHAGSDPEKFAGLSSIAENYSQAAKSETMAAAGLREEKVAQAALGLSEDIGASAERSTGLAERLSGAMAGLAERRGLANLLAQAVTCPTPEQAELLAATLEARARQRQATETN